MNVIININSSSAWNITLNTTLNMILNTFLLVHTWIKQKIKLMGGAMRLYRVFFNKILSHGIFNSVVSWVKVVSPPYVIQQNMSQSSNLFSLSANKFLLYFIFIFWSSASFDANIFMLQSSAQLHFCN